MCLGAVVAVHAEEGGWRRIRVADYRDRMKAGWIGQIAGVAWGAPTEFKWKDQIIPADKVPVWKPEMINHAFGQDDLYVEMTFLRTLEEYGLDATIRQAGIDFANSRYPLWCANKAGRENLRRGIAPPDSGHPKFNKCPNDIDYQIEADFSGLIAPGLPQAAIDLGEIFGRLMNYGDGLYAGQFMGAMYAEAFFESDPVAIAEAGLRAIPPGSQYAEMVRDLVAWYKAAPDDWEATWAKCQAKYRKNPEYQKASNGGIDCKINGAYVLLGLLHGRRDPDATIVISCRGGQDSDCNPSSSAGVLFTTMGYSNLPARFNTGLDETKVFSHTAYTFPRLLDVCEKLARQIVVKYGGRIEKGADGGDVFAIPVTPPRPSALELSWAPGPIAGSVFTDEEKARIDQAPGAEIQAAVDRVVPGWKVTACGTDMNPGIRATWGGRTNVLVTHPLNEDTGCVLSRTLNVPVSSAPALGVTVGHDPRGDFDLIVRIEGNEILRTTVGPDTAKAGWRTERIDLSPWAGRTVRVELVNQPTGWTYEAAYWCGISIEAP
jgi:hypothetical protein